MLVSYIVLIIVIAHNIVNFLIKQQRYKSFHITLIYLLTSFVVVVRIVWFSMILCVTTQPAAFYTNDVRSALEITDAVATYCELFLGI